MVGTPARAHRSLAIGSVESLKTLPLKAFVLEIQHIGDSHPSLVFSTLALLLLNDPVSGEVIQSLLQIENILTEKAIKI
jgi:hypothetical protein